MVRERQAAVEKVERHDLFSSLLEANDHDFDQETLTENEIISMPLLLTLLTNTDRTFQVIFIYSLLLDTRSVTHTFRIFCAYLF